MEILRKNGGQRPGAGKRPHLPWSTCCVLIGIVTALFCTYRVSGQELVAPEYKVKAAFLYNFTKLTEWPTNAFAGTNGPLVIGVLGKDPFGRELEEITAGKTVTGRRIGIVHFDRVDQVRDCQVLFISASEGLRMAYILGRLSRQPILTVSETGQFARQGGVIGLVKSGDEIHFEVNLETATSVGLKLSSKLLRLAEVVRPEPGKRQD